MAYSQVVAATSTGITVTGGFPVPTSSTMDGVSLTTNVSRVLLTGQGTLGTPEPQTNGVWIFKGANTAMARPTGGDQYTASNTLDNALIVWVTSGNVFAGTVWGLDPAGIVVVNTTNHTLTQVALPPVQAIAATTGSNLNLSSTFTTLDGVTLTGNGAQGSNIVLVKDQSTASQNGLYWANTGGAMVRCTEPHTPARKVLVSQGTSNAHTDWLLNTQGAITVGTTSISFSRQLVWANVKDFGAVGDGSTSDDAAFIAASGTGANAIHVPAGSYKLSNNVTFPSNQTLRFEGGAVLNPISGKTVTIQGSIVAGETQQIFTPAASYSATPIVFSQGMKVSTKWFGAKADGSTDDSLAIAAAIASVTTAGGTVHFPAGTHVVGSAATVTAPSNVQMHFEEGAMIAPSGQTVTLNGRVAAHPTQQIFGGTGSIGAMVDSNVSGGPAVTVNGTYGAYPSFAIEITTGGALGIAQFQYSLNGGISWLPATPATTAATYAVPNTGMTITFPSGMYTQHTGIGVGDYYSWESGKTTPSASGLSTVTVGLSSSSAGPWCNASFVVSITTTGSSAQRWCSRTPSAG